MNVIFAGLYWFEKIAIYHLPVLTGWVWAVLLVAAAIAVGIWAGLAWWQWVALMVFVAVYLTLSFYAWVLSGQTL